MPEQYRWFDFGGTMRRVDEEADLQAGYVKFQTKQTEQLLGTLQHGDKFAKARATNNLKQIGLGVQNYKAAAAEWGRSNPALQSELAANASISQQAQQEVAHQEKAPEQAQPLSNREQLGNVFRGQNFKQARNVVNELGANFSEAAEQKPAGEQAEGRRFNSDWFYQNSLVAGDQSGKDEKAAGKELALELRQRGEARGPSSSPSRTATPGFGGRQLQSNKTGEKATQPSAVQVVQPRVIIQEEESEKPRIQAPGQQAGSQYGGKQDDSVERYKQRLEQQTQNLFSSDVSGIPNAPAEPGSQLQAGLSLGRVRVAPSTTATDTQREALQRKAGEVTHYDLSRAYQGAMSDRDNAVRFGVTNDKSRGGLVNPAQIEMLEGLDVLVLRGSPEDVDQVQKIIKQVEELGKKETLAATGLASLDFQLPERGTLYCLTTPQDKVEITAREVSDDLLRRLAGIAIVAVAALIAWFLISLVRRGSLARLTGPTGSTLLICLGLLSLFCGVLPVVGLAAVVAGCGAKIGRKLCRS